MPRVPSLRFRAFSSAAGLAVLAFFLAGALPARAQQPEMGTLVAPLAQEIVHSHKHKVIVLPLLCSNPKNAPLGVWLAKQVSAALAASVPDFQLVYSSESPALVKEEPGGNYPTYDPKKVEDVAKKAGADLVVTGNFAPFEEGLGISLSMGKRNGKNLTGESNGKIALTPEMTALAPQPLRYDLPADGVYRAGWGGIGIPLCVHCPDPDYSLEDQARKYEGVVVMEVVIGVTGQPLQIVVKKAPNTALAMLVASTVKNWKFQPALGPSGKPVAVRVPVDVTFRPHN